MYKKVIAVLIILVLATTTVVSAYQTNKYKNASIKHKDQIVSLKKDIVVSATKLTAVEKKLNKSITEKEFILKLDNILRLTNETEVTSNAYLFKTDSGSTLKSKMAWHSELTTSFSAYKASIERSTEEINEIDENTLSNKSKEILTLLKEYQKQRLSFATSVLKAFNPEKGIQNSIQSSEAMREQSTDLKKIKEQYDKLVADYR